MLLFPKTFSFQMWPTQGILGVVSGFWLQWQDNHFCPETPRAHSLLCMITVICISHFLKSLETHWIWWRKSLNWIYILTNWVVQLVINWALCAVAGHKGLQLCPGLVELRLWTSPSQVGNLIFVNYSCKNVEELIAIDILLLSVSNRDMVYISTKIHQACNQIKVFTAYF